MRLLGTYLWKEWRDHRAVLVGMLVAVPLLLVVMGLALPRTALDGADIYAANKRSGFAAVAALACFALFVVSLATDLVPGEARRGHRWFLERLPGGLGAAFRGKLALFAVGGALFAAYGYLAAAVTCRLVAGEWPSLPWFGPPVWIIAIVALWTFAVSCSLPRGALSLPAAAALALLLALPLILCFEVNPGGRIPDWWAGAPLLLLWGVGGALAAWLAFRRPGFLRGGRACLVIGAVCAMPYWADAGYAAYRWHAHAVPHLADGFVGEGGRYLFLNRYAHHEAPGHSHGAALAPLIVDLESGHARQLASEALFYAAGVEWPSYRGIAQRYLTLSDGTALVAYDARTAQPASRTEDDHRAAQRIASPWRLGDGRRMWFNGGKLEADTRDGSGFEVLDKSRDWSPCGLGLTRNRAMYYDLFRERAYKQRDIALRGDRVWIRPGRWLTSKNRAHRLFDPDANAFGPALGLEAADEIRVIADDGRVFARREGMPALVDPETGATTVLAVPPGLADATVVEVARAFDRPTRTPDGRRVVLLYGPIGGGGADVYWCALARIDAGDKLATTAVLRGFTMLLGCPNDDEAIVTLNGETVVRLRFGSHEKEEIWRVR